MPNYSQQIQSTPPKSDEFELSLFGPGIGECIVAHLGNNEWVIVDSCINSSSKDPIAFEYLNNIGVNPLEDVKLIVISHWHSDHIKGASNLVKECREAMVCYSAGPIKGRIYKFSFYVLRSGRKYL